MLKVSEVNYTYI